MKLARVRMSDGSLRVAAVHADSVQPLDLTQIDQCHSLMDILNSADPVGLARFLLKPDTKLVPLAEVKMLSPVDQQEVWAAGVTYKCSQVARMEQRNWPRRITTKSTRLIVRSYSSRRHLTEFPARTTITSSLRQQMERTRARVYWRSTPAARSWATRSATTCQLAILKPESPYCDRHVGLVSA